MAPGSQVNNLQIGEDAADEIVQGVEEIFPRTLADASLIGKPDRTQNFFRPGQCDTSLEFASIQSIMNDLRIQVEFLDLNAQPRGPSSGKVRSCRIDSITPNSRDLAFEVLLMVSVQNR